jgi:hypothetical protein
MHSSEFFTLTWFFPAKMHPLNLSSEKSLESVGSVNVDLSQII